MTINTNFKLKIKKSILIIGDILTLYISLFLALFIRFYGNFTKTTYINHVFYFSIAYAMWLIMIFSFKLYENNNPIKKTNELIISIAYFSIINLFLSVLYFYIIPNDFITPKTILILDIFIFGILFFFWRKLINKIIYRYNTKINCLIITNNPELISGIKQKPELELNVKKYINPNGQINIFESENVDLNNINTLLQENKIQTIVIDDELLFNKNISDALLKSLKLKIEIIKSSDFYEIFLGKVAIRNINHVWILSNFNENKKFVFDFLKNLSDKIFICVFLIISIIIVPFIILAIIIDSKGPVFFSQIRTGKNGKVFLAIKFRSMKIDAEKSGPQWATENDSRTTRVGKFLRKTRLDEIPQFINILKGEMSLIGPRPERPEFIQMLEKEIPFYNQRLLVKPGLTGWAQINYPYGNSIEDTLEKLEYDLYYIKNRSFALDISIVLKTINTILKGGGM